MTLSAGQVILNSTCDKRGYRPPPWMAPVTPPQRNSYVVMTSPISLPEQISKRTRKEHFDTASERHCLECHLFLHLFSLLDFIWSPPSSLQFLKNLKDNNISTVKFPEESLARII
nr:hypothetical protein BgiMline_034200 [Biomphalaria glabrata]